MVKIDTLSHRKIKKADIPIHVQESIFIKQLSNRIKSSYNVSLNQTIGNTSIALKAEYKRYDAKYMLSKGLHLWAVENGHLLFLHAPDEALNKAYLKQVEANLWQYLMSQIKCLGKRNASSGYEHMSTTVVMLLVTSQPISLTTQRECIKYRKWRLIRFGLGGWIEAYIAIADLQSNQLYMHKKGRELLRPLSLGFHIRS